MMFDVVGAPMKLDMGNKQKFAYALLKELCKQTVHLLGMLNIEYLLD